jgi:hypothetical protein
MRRVTGSYLYAMPNDLMVKTFRLQYEKYDESTNLKLLIYCVSLSDTNEYRILVRRNLLPVIAIDD